MRRPLTAPAGLLLLAMAALALGGCGHYHHSHGGSGYRHGAYSTMGGHGYGPGCPYTP